MRVLVLGAGRVGSAIVRDLAAEDGWRVTAVDRDEGALAALGVVDGVTTRAADLADVETVSELAREHELVVSAVPGPMGFRTLETVIDAGVDVVDIAFFEEDPLPLDELARARGVRAVVDCGIAPGCSNLILGWSEATFDRVDRFACMVGGLPAIRRLPWEYAAVFSPIDVLAEYTRPARLRDGGRDVERPALSGVELVEIDGVGTMEAFETDGLRTLLVNSTVPDMVEKTMRYPGHAERIRLLRDAGFLGEEPVDVGGLQVRPIDLTAALLFPAWRLGEGEEDLTAMRVEVDAVRDGTPVRRRWELLDRYDRDTGTTSMA